MTWLHRDGLFAAFALPGEDLWRLMADVRSDHADPDVVGQLRRLMAERTDLTGAHIGDAEWTSTFRIQRRLADTYRRGRILLAGDAAHIHSPLGGQGMNTGLGDAENLAWKLTLVADGRAADALLDTYQAERRPIAEEVLSNTTFATKLLLGGTPLSRLVRDRLAARLMNLPLVQNRIVHKASQLGINYRGGPLAPKVRGLAGPHPGDRVPDLTCTRPDGSTAKLHTELVGRWALLVPLDKQVPIAEQLSDELVVLRYQGPDVLLVRPDAHLAWRDRPGPARLGAWLDNMLTRGKVA
jgi:4,5-epoxidase